MAALKNYTTTVSVSQTVSDIHKALADHGARKVMFDYHKHYDIQSRVGWVSEVAKLTPSMIQDAVSYPWSGAMFSDRLWQNKNALVFNIREIITQSLIQGKNLPETSKALSNKMGQSYKVAERLVRTETSHLHNRADLFAY